MERQSKLLKASGGPVATALEFLEREAQKRKGKCLGLERDARGRAVVHLQCQRGHVWKTTPAWLLAGNWCWACVRQATVDEILNRARAIAKERGGRCLSDEYRPGQKLSFECAKGHQWSTLRGNLMRGSWCRPCSDVERSHGIEAMRTLAGRRGWKCLSGTYKDANSDLLWECRSGHRWKARPANIMKNGTGCPNCAGQVLTLGDMQTLALGHGGLCLSKEYVNSKTKLLWRCGKGHRFEMIPNAVQQGGWCSICAHKGPITVEDLQRRAKKFGGKCLSLRYKGSTVKHRWICKASHLFLMTPSDVSQGHWCRLCYNERVRQRHRRNRAKRNSA